MAAPQKTGLNYYPRDTDLLKDRKFVKAKIKYGYLSLVVYDALLEIIYRDKGYYVDYSEEEKETVVWDILESLRGKYLVEAATIYKVIEMLVECRLFSRYHFEQGIITSKRIQETYYKCTVERKNVEVEKNIWMLTVPEMEALSKKSTILSFFINQPNNEDNRQNNEANQSHIEQSKENKNKEKENIVNENKGNETTIDSLKGVGVNEGTYRGIPDKINQVYCQCFLRSMTSTDRDLILKWLNTFDVDLICEALRLTKEQGKSFIGYTRGILENWYKEGITDYVGYLFREE